MYHVRYDQDEFEPRITPKQTSKLDSCIIPSVPEVSLIFDKPSRLKNLEQKDLAAVPAKATEPNSLPHTNSISPLPNNDGSYAAWREQNFSWKPSVSRNQTENRSRYNQNYITRSDSLENVTVDASKRNNYHSKSDLDNVPKSSEQRLHRINSNGSCKVTYPAQEDNRVCIKENRNSRTHCNTTVKNVENCNSYSVNQEGRSPLTHTRNLKAHNSDQQKILFNGPFGKPMQTLNATPAMLGKNEFQPPVHLEYQYPYIDVNGYPFQPIYGNPYPNHNIENQETVKNLMQLVNSQCEQIKSLQIQVDRLLKMQEESFKERRRCTCSSQVSPHNEQLLKDSYDTVNTSNCIVVPPSQSIRKNTSQNASSKETTKENSNESKNGNQAELTLAEAQSKKTFMEQKVSIGVMTSFEFTVQNSPFALNSEDYTEKETQQTTENLNLHSGINLCDTSETLRRYKNSFARIPSGHLENIVEDSESYLSSSQQQSSNLNASISTKDLEKQTQRDADICRADSLEPCENVFQKTNQNKVNAQRYSERVFNEEMQRRNITKSPKEDTVQYNTEGTTTRKVNIPTSGNQQAKINVQRQSTNSPISRAKNSEKEKNIAISKQTKCIEDSLILSGGDLRVGEISPPTPEPSIHVEMNEYSSDDDSEKVKRSSKVGWTFYNNVLGQVNQILQNSCVIDDQEQNQLEVARNKVQDEAENRVAMDTVKVATLEQLRKLGISLNDNHELKDLNAGKKVEFDSSFYPRLDPQANVMHATSGVNETNTSMHMKALALKYLSDEQLAELAMHRQGSKSLKHLMVSNMQGTNMSFATMRYLERYQLLPGKNNLQAEGNSKVHVEVSPRTDVRFANPTHSAAVNRFPFSQTTRTSCPSKILDISTLKQQPKLL